MTVWGTAGMGWAAVRVGVTMTAVGVAEATAEVTVGVAMVVD